MKRYWVRIGNLLYGLAVISCAFVCLCGYVTAVELDQVSSWTYQLQDADPEELALDPTTEMVVIDYSRDGSDEGRYSKADIQKLKDAGKIVIAYFSIGEAEDYRFYWQDKWDRESNPEPPTWLAEENPNWPGNYLVRYWDGNWKAIIFDYLTRIGEAGFDGVYLDRVDSYYDWQLRGESSVSPQKEMIFLVSEIRAWSRSLVSGGMKVIIQNGETVINEPGIDERYIKLFMDSVDGVAVEDLFFPGDLEVDNPFAPETYRVGILEQFQERGIPVFAVDYLTEKSRKEKFVIEAENHGYIPLVAGRALDHLVPGLGRDESLNWDGVGRLVFDVFPGRTYHIEMRDSITGEGALLWNSSRVIPTTQGMGQVDVPSVLFESAAGDLSWFFTLEIDFFP